MIALLGLFLLAAPTRAMESIAVRSDRVTATLISDTDAVVPGIPLRVGLRLRIAPGWHTYWKNPGDAGAAPELTLTLPSGAKAGDIEWPTPARLPEGPVMTYSYSNEVVLPVIVTPGPGGLDIQASASWLVCERICVPEEGTFHLQLPAGAAGRSAEAPWFDAASARVPRPSPFEARIAPDGVLSLIGAGLSPTTVKDAWFFPSQWGPVEQAALQSVRVTEGRVDVALRPGSGFKPETQLDGTMVLRDPGGQESFLQLTANPGAAAVETQLWQAIGFALLGGLILNLMPCVFPVLAMKAVAITRLSGQGHSAVRAHALSYSAGVLVAFAALGGMLLAVRASGTAVGWGFQFQSPIFVASLAFVLFAVGLNLSGVFDVGGRVTGAGQGLTAQQGHAGSFFTGLLAVIVATPCTAPFMGAALAAALAAPVMDTMLVFLAMGLGLAAPYGLLAAVPAAARLLPRPGPWMNILKGVLAFPMYGASAWLVWVVSLQAGPSGVLAVAAGLVLIGFAAWTLGLAQASGRRFGYAVSAIAAAASIAVLPGLSIAPNATAAVTEGIEPFTPGRLAELRGQGRPVFVNMTASWCVTCLVNERIALKPSAVRQAFVERNVAYLKGDWTRGDPAVTIFLREYARDGVPLYVLYPAGAGAPSVLPQILTEAEILARLRKI